MIRLIFILFGFAKCVFAFCLQLCLQLYLQLCLLMSMPNYASTAPEVMTTTDSSDIHDHSALSSTASFKFCPNSCRYFSITLVCLSQHEHHRLDCSVRPDGLEARRLFIHHNLRNGACDKGWCYTHK